MHQFLYLKIQNEKDKSKLFTQTYFRNAWTTLEKRRFKHFVTKCSSFNNFYNFQTIRKKRKFHWHQKKGRPRKLCKYEVIKLKKVVVDRSEASNLEIGRKFGISKETVRQILINMDAKFH